MPNFTFLAFTILEILRMSQKSKIGSRDPYVTPFVLFFHFFRYYSLQSISVPNLKYLTFTVLEILEGPDLGAKFEVSSFYRSGDIRGVPKFRKRVT